MLINVDQPPRYDTPNPSLAFPLLFQPPQGLDLPFEKPLVCAAMEAVGSIFQLPFIRLRRARSMCSRFGMGLYVSSAALSQLIEQRSNTSGLEFTTSQGEY